MTVAHQAMQYSISNWGQIIIASVGELKAPKCFYRLISFCCNTDGSWTFENNVDVEDFNIRFLIPDGSQVQIEHATVDTAKETLGVWTNLVGDSKVALEKMQNKADEWISRAKEGTLSRRNVWFLLDRQLCPRLGYGLIRNISHWHKLTACLKKQCLQLIPLGGVPCTAPAGVCQTHRGFYGIGFPHVGVDCFIDQTNKVLMKYGCPPNVGMKMKIFTEYMILDMGISLQPLQESYKKYEQLTTPSWIKSLWDKCDWFDVMVEFNNTLLEIFRCGEKWMMR